MQDANPRSRKPSLPRAERGEESRTLSKYQALFSHAIDPSNHRNIELESEKNVNVYEIEMLRRARPGSPFDGAGHDTFHESALEKEVDDQQRHYAEHGYGHIRRSLRLSGW